MGLFGFGRKPKKSNIERISELHSSDWIIAGAFERKRDSDDEDLDQEDPSDIFDGIEDGEIARADFKDYFRRLVDSLWRKGFDDGWAKGYETALNRVKEILDENKNDNENWRYAFRNTTTQKLVSEINSTKGTEREDDKDYLVDRRERIVNAMFYELRSGKMTRDSYDFLMETLLLDQTGIWEHCRLAHEAKLENE